MTFLKHDALSDVTVDDKNRAESGDKQARIRWREDIRLSFTLV